MKKQKLKTKKAAIKRIKITSSGKLKRYATGKRHLLTHKPSDKKRNKRMSLTISKADEKSYKLMLPGVK